MAPPTSTASDAPPRRPSPLALLFAPIPGIGHWAVRRGGRGFLTFAVFAAGVNVVLLSRVMAPVQSLSPVWGWVLAGAAVLYSLVDVTRIVLRARGE